MSQVANPLAFLKSITMDYMPRKENSGYGFSLVLARLQYSRSSHTLSNTVVSS